MRMPTFFVIVGFSLLGMVLTGRVLAQSTAHPLADIISAQSQYPQRIGSIQTNFHAENTLVPQGRTQKWDTTYAAKGAKYLEKQKWEGENSPPPVLYNGGASYLVTYDTSAVTGTQIKTAETKVKKRESPAPHVLSFGYQWNEQWIGDLLKNNDFQLTGTENDPQFGTLYRVAGVARKGQPYPYSLTFWFAPQYGFLAVRTEAQPSDGQGMKLIYRTTDLVKQGDLWFAKSGVREAYIMGTNDVGVRYTMNVSEIQINTVSDGVFNPTLAAGGKLYDQDANIVYRIGPQGEKVVDRRFANNNQNQRMLFGWLFMASLATLVLLGAGFLLRRRRQNRAA